MPGPVSAPAQSSVVGRLGGFWRRRCASSIQCKTIAKDLLHLPGPDFVDRVYADRSRAAVQARCSNSSTTAVCTARAYVSILPVDQGIEHSAGASFAPNPAYFDLENIVKLGIEGGCNAVASTLGVLGSVARRYAHRIPFILKFNHNEFILPQHVYDQIRFASADRQASTWALSVLAPRSTSDRRSPNGNCRSVRDIPACARARHVHRAVVLPSELGVQNQGNRLPSVGRSDRSGQPSRRYDRGRHHQAETARRTTAATRRSLRKTHKAVSQLSSDNPIDLTRYQLANCCFRVAPG